MQLSDACELLLLDHIFQDPDWTPSPYLALCTATPTETDTGASISEAAYTGYTTRPQITAAIMNAAASGAKDNGSTITFDACTGGSETEKAWALCSSATPGAGVLYLHGMLVTTGTQVRAYADVSLNLFHSPAHGFIATDTVVLDFEGTIGGITRDTEYTVATVPDANSFTLTGVTLTGEGFLMVGESAWRTVSSGVTPQFTASNFVVRAR